MLLTAAAHACLDVDVIPIGWGGDVPTGILDTTCHSGLRYHWEPLLTSLIFPGSKPQLRVSDCTSFENVVTQPEPFFYHLAMMRESGAAAHAAQAAALPAELLRSLNLAADTALRFYLQTGSRMQRSDWRWTIPPTSRKSGRSEPG